MIPVLFRDARYAVLDKPAGLPVHPTRAPGPSVEDSFGELGRFRAGPWLAHRLDRDTAGCLVVALRRAALLAAQRCFAQGRAEKTYWAVVRGAPAQATGTRRSHLARVEANRAWRMVERAEAGETAETAWRVLGRGEDQGGGAQIAWLELRPRTGRTHQIRVHCAALGCPIVGDRVYGACPPADGGSDTPLHLLARRIALPVDPAIAAEAPPPPHMRAALSACGWVP